MADQALSDLPFLQRVYAQDGVSLFRVAPPSEVLGYIQNPGTRNGER